MKKVLLLYGGNSSEHDVSCLSANSIIKNIDETKYIITCVKITKDNIWLENDSEIKNIIDFIKKFDVVFPIIHGKNGEDGTLQGMFDLFNIKYVGSKCGASYICMDKERTKQILSYLNIPQVEFQLYENKPITINYPLIVKPASGGSSIGISLANNEEELNKATQLAKQYDDKIMIEKAIKMRELECAVIVDNNQLIMNIGEIIADCNNNFYDFDAKYNSNNSKTITDIKLDDSLKNKIYEYSETLFKKLQLKSLARIDFFYDIENNEILVNEINTIPGFTEISMFPKLIMDKGYSYKDIITTLIENI